MELYIYDADMNMLGIVEQITSLIWTRRYWDCGEFKLLVPFNDAHNRLLQAENIVIKHGDDEAAEILYTNISKNLEGYEVIEVQGKFLLNWISRRVIATPFVNVSATAQVLIRRMVNENCIDTTPERKLPAFSLHEDAVISGKSIPYNSEPYANVQDAAVELAEGSKIGMKVITDRAAGTHQFSVYKGVDCTADNTAGNPPCIFSQEYDNVLEQEYTKSTEKHKTTAYVTGEETEDKSPMLVIVNGENSGLARKELYVSAGDIKQTYKDDDDKEITLTDAEYESALAARGGEKLEQYLISQAFSSEINVGANLIYRKDFDLGDRVTCVNKTWNVRIDARITEISEIYEVDGEGLEITFGESIPSIYKQIKSMATGG